MMILILVVMREKHKKMIDENELLKTKLREANGCVRNYLYYYFFNDHLFFSFNATNFEQLIEK